jgi:Tfp pilus assembly protein PilO
MFKKRENQITILSILLLVIVSLFWFKPVLSGRNFKKNEIERYQAVLKSKKISKKDILELQQQISTLKLEKDELRNQLPSTEKRGILIKDLEALAKKHNINLETFLPKETTKINFVGEEIDQRKMRSNLYRRDARYTQPKALKTSIEIDSNGNYFDYKSFFADIMSYYRAVEVTNLTMNRGAGSSTNTTIKADKRFVVKNKRGKSLAEEASQSLNVDFTLIAYTSIPDEPNIINKHADDN